MFVQIDQLYGSTNSSEYSIFEWLGLTYHSYYQAVVVLIVGVIQQFHTLFATEIVNNFLNFSMITAFAKVRHALYYSIHLISDI
jgi:sensor histidine kinase YesM